MTDRLFSELVRNDLGFQISGMTVRNLKPKFKTYQGKMSDFNKVVYFNQELYSNFLNILKSNTHG